jgi:uroporphyrinogen decarboxylase
MLNDEVPLIGFAGSPWTIMCYAVEGQGSKSFDKAKGFCFHIQKQHMFYYKKITDTTILYLKEKVKKGVNAVQILILGAECYLTS